MFKTLIVQVPYGRGNYGYAPTGFRQLDIMVIMGGVYAQVSAVTGCLVPVYSTDCRGVVKDCLYLRSFRGVPSKNLFLGAQLVLGS